MTTSVRTSGLDTGARFFLIIGEPCPTTFLAMCQLSQLDKSIVIVHGKCVEHAMRLLDIANLVGVVFANLNKEQWAENGSARRFVSTHRIAWCAIVDEQELATASLELDRDQDGQALITSRRTLATDLEDFFRSRVKEHSKPFISLDRGGAAPAGQAQVSLTRRQRDVLDLLQRGYSSKRIVAQLGLNKGTVDNHVSGLLRALGANNRAHALAIATELRLHAQGADAAALAGPAPVRPALSPCRFAN